MDAKTEQIAFLGLGAMGQRMAARLLDAGHRLLVYNRSPGPLAPLVARGAQAAASPREAARGADVVISMVTDDAASRSIWLAPEQGAVHGLGARALAIEASTLRPQQAQDFADAARSVGAAAITAPVVGTLPQAETGALVVLAGGEAEAVDRARPILAAFAGRVELVGDVHASMAMKLAVNAWLALQVEGLAEVLGLAQAAGVEAGSARTLLASLPITAPALAGLGQRMIEGDRTSQFPIRLVAKDLDYARAESATEDSPLLRAAAERFAEAAAAGLGDENIHAVFRLQGRR